MGSGKWQDAVLLFTTNVGPPPTRPTADSSGCWTGQVSPASGFTTCGTPVRLSPWPRYPGKARAELVGHSQVGLSPGTYSHVAPGDAASNSRDERYPERGEAVMTISRSQPVLCSSGCQSSGCQVIRRVPDFAKGEVLVLLPSCRGCLCRATGIGAYDPLTLKDPQGLGALTMRYAFPCFL